MLFIFYFKFKVITRNIDKMQGDDREVELECRNPRRSLNTLDSALNELGMLATAKDPRREYLHEMHNHMQKPPSVVRMLRINTRYVSNVSIGFQLRPTTPHVRYKPYSFTKKEERHRTRSENNDSNETFGIVKGLLEQSVEEACVDDMAQLKKAKSLESIIAENDLHVDFKSLSIPENEVVSHLEKLKVVE